MDDDLWNKREALYRKPLESNYLVYSRATTALTMAVLFLCFCGFLISQIYFDRYLIETSSEQIINDIDTPDIEICVQNTTMRVNKCNAMYYNWTSVDVPNCWERFFRPGVPEPGSTARCYVFETNNTYRMATGLVPDNRVALRRLDFYWNIDSLYNLSYNTVSIPAVAVQLYDPHFSFWKKYTLGKSKVEEETITNLQLGATRATTIFNYTSNIFYFPQKYRAIRPFDTASIIGFKPSYIDIITLKNYQHNWPLLPNPPQSAYNRSLYQGLFSVQLGQSTIDVKSEVRQYTLLASVALAGGCYGVLTTVYILLFGMTRLTPWGLVHYIPALISTSSKRKQGKYNSHNNQVLSVAKRESILIPLREERKRNSSAAAVFSDTFSRLKRKDKSQLTERGEDIHLEMQGVYPGGQSEQELMPSSIDINSLYRLLVLEKEKSEKLEIRSEELLNRVEELEMILTEYFIDTAYLDNIRHKQNIFTVVDDQGSDQKEI